MKDRGKKKTIGDKNQLKKKHSFFSKVILYVNLTIRFLTRDMWRLSDDDFKGKRGFLIRIIKPVYLAIDAFIEDKLSQKASALTYSTILSIVPMLAVIVGVAKGFGVQQMITETLLNYFPSHRHELNTALGFVDNYFSQIQGGWFVGIGLGILLYTVISLIAGIENTLNDIWQCTKPRPWGRRVVDYMAMFVVLPILMTFSSGITIIIGTVQNALPEQYLLFLPAIGLLWKAIPFFIIIIIFTAFYMALPNTKVKFLPAFISGCLAGVAFQVLQALYVNGIIWISKYNAIYGSFAAVPLLLLFLQVSWTICLFGAQLSFAIQNVRTFNFNQDCKNISRRYNDFIVILVASQICKRFANILEKKPYSAEDLSNECKIPIQLTKSALQTLLDIDIIIEVNYKGDQVTENYQPAIDPAKLTVGYLIDKLDKHGSERFKTDNLGEYNPQWEAMLATRESILSKDTDILLKDI